MKRRKRLEVGLTGSVEDIDVEEVSESDLILGEFGGEIEGADGDVLQERHVVSSEMGGFGSIPRKVELTLTLYESRLLT
jgi:hypothetical protein